MPSSHGRVLAHVATNRRRVVDLAEISYLEAAGGDTWLRPRRGRRIKDLRTLGTLHPLWEGFGFVRVHRSFAVNIRHILEIRHREDGHDWELQLEPPANRVIPISRNYLRDLWAAFGER